MVLKDKVISKERVHWIDIAKGLMIIGMILNHVPNYSMKMGYDISQLRWFLIGSFYGKFTMQTFFLLAGLTLNMNYNFRQFLWKNIKGLVIPYFFFCVVCQIFDHFLWNESFYYNMNGESFIFLLEGFWFLSALFVAKILLYLLNKISSSKCFLAISVLICTFVGFGINDLYHDVPEPSHYHNYFHYRNGLSMMVFMYIGYILKDIKIKDSTLLKAGALYVATYCVSFVLLYFDINIHYFAPPSYSHNLVMGEGIWALGLVPAYIFYCTTGSLLIIWISKKIGKNCWIESLGQQTLVIYCVHFTILKALINVFGKLLNPESIPMCGIYFILTAFCTILFSYFVSLLFKYKPMNYCIGKF